jgi:hypothetical protein
MIQRGERHGVSPPVPPMAPPLVTVRLLMLVVPLRMRKGRNAPPPSMVLPLPLTVIVWPPGVSSGDGNDVSVKELVTLMT